MAAPVTRNLTILLTDIKGFTDKTSHQSRLEIQSLLDEHKSIVLPLLESKGGKLVKTIGDAFLMVYESPTDAVLAGVAVQEALTLRNSGRPAAERIEVRIAINSGEVNLSDNDIFGEPVNITARIEGVAEAGEVFFTEAVYLAMNKTEVPSSEVGLLQLKGIPEKIRVYKVKREEPVQGLALPRAAPAMRGFWRLFQGQAPAPKLARTDGAPALPKLWRRAAALAIDALLCSILAGIFVGKDRENFNVRYKAGEARAARARRAAKAGVDFDGKGLQVEGEDGSHVSLGREGIRVESKDSRVVMGKGGIEVRSGPHGRGAAAQADEEDAESVLYDEDGLRVSKRKEKKDKAFPVVWLLYNTLFLGLWSATPGKRILRLKVSLMEGGNLDWKLAFARSLLTLISGVCLFLGYLWAVWERDRRGWHDLLAGTRVSPAE